MLRDTIRSLQFVAALAAMAAWMLLPVPAHAEETPDPGRPRPHSTEPRARVQARVESRSDGVYVQIEVRQTVPGSQQSAPRAESERPSLGPRPVAVGGSGPSAAPAPSTNSTSARNNNAGRSWYDPVRGYFHESPDGHMTHLTMPNIGNASADHWREEFRQRPNQSPWLVYRDGELVDLIWLPSQTNPETVRFGEPPAEPALQVAAPSGGGVRLDPREVALDTLEHVPLPDIRIRTNPSLGLVAMPGWFWVDGYDGRPFGLSRTVEVPAEVGVEVPVDVVPADDPRRRGSSFTVDVRVWASKYEWNFGDGASMVAQSLGRPYPAESDIKHTYELSSLRFPGGFPVRLTVEYSAEYRVNGGAPQTLPALRRTYEAAYRVQEVQPVLTNR